MGDIPGLREKTSTDGADFRVSSKPHPRQWYSFKFKQCALRYEITLSIQSGDIVWASSAFKASTHDITIFRIGGLKDKLIQAGEKTVCDLGYRGEPDVVTLSNSGSQMFQEQMSSVRARHETVNRRMKVFQVLNENFRQGIEFHNTCFDAVLVLTQLNMQNGEPLFSVKFTGEDE